MVLDIRLSKSLLVSKKSSTNVPGLIVDGTKTISLIDWINARINDGSINAATSGGAISDGDKGDIVVSSEGSVWSLDSTGVTAGTYNSANVTVGADGRITSISNGVGGGGSLEASGVTTTATGNLTSTNVQAALEELQSDIDNISLPAETGIYEGSGSLSGNTTVDADNASFTLNDAGVITLATRTGNNIVLSDTSDDITMVWSDGSNPSKSIIFNDNALQYNADYSSDYTSRSLVDKAYVDNEIAGIPSAGAASSITLTPNGNLTSTNVQSALYELQGDIDILSSGGADGNGIYTGNGSVSADTTVTLASNSDLNITLDSSSTFDVSTSNNSTKIEANAATSTITFNSGTKSAFFSNQGLHYSTSTASALVSGDFTDNSLVHKGYVDAEIASVSSSGAASDITVTPTGNISSIDVQSALQEIQADVDSITIPSNYNASDIIVTPSGNLTSSNVQAALTELQGDINTLASDPGVDVYSIDGSLSADRTINADSNTLSITNLPTGGFSVTSGAKTATFSSVNGWGYSGDYSPDFTDGSLVDKRYVDDAVFNLPAREVALAGSNTLDFESGEDFTATAGTNHYWDVTNPIVHKPLRIKVTAGNLRADLFNGYTLNWIGGSSLADYNASIDNYLYVELRSNNEIYLFFES